MARITASTVTSGSGVEETRIVSSLIPTGCHQAPSAASAGSGQSVFDRQRDAVGGEAAARDPADEPVRGRHPVAIEQGVQAGLLGASACVDGGRDLDVEAEFAQQRDPGASAIEGARPAVAVVQLGRPGVQRHLHRHAVGVERVQHAPARAARQHHRVGEDGDRRPARGHPDQLAELGVQERLAAGDQDLAPAEPGELLARAGGDLDRQPARAARGGEAAQQ